MRAATFFIIRSPLLEAARIGGDPAGHLALPEVREALRWASPSLLAAVTTERRRPAGGDPGGPDLPLTRYIERMAGRATPFSLMAGYTAGVVEAGATEVRLGPRGSYRRILRAELNSVRRWLMEAVNADPTAVPWRARLDVVWLPDRLRVSTRSEDGQEVTMVDVDRGPAIDAVLQAAREPVTFATLVETALLGGARRDQADAFVRSLVDLELLAPALLPSVLVGRETTALASLPQTRALATHLDSLRETRLDEAVSLEALETTYKVAPSSLLVDLEKPAESARLGHEVIAALRDVVGIFQRVILPRRRDRRMKHFCEQFFERYESREVSLVEALDSHRGLPFPVRGEGVEQSEDENERNGWLAGLLSTALRQGQDEVVLDPSLARRPPRWPLPHAFSMEFSLAREPLSIWSPSLSGPPGTLLFARAAGVLSPHVTDSIRAFLQVSSDTDDADWCDLDQYLPGKEVATATFQYPALQPFNLSLMSGSPDHGVTVDPNDVLLSLRRQRVVLRSRSTGRELKIRKTNAANPQRSDTTALYRFLCAVAREDGPPHSWTWGALGTAPYLPRVRHGDHVLAPAQWSLDTEQSTSLRTGRTVKERFDLVQSLRTTLRLPRHVRFHEVEDLTLPVDLDDPWSVEAWLDIVRDKVTLREAFPVERSVVTSAEGRFHHEIVVPFHGPPAARRREEVSPPGALDPAMSPFDDVAPGGDVLYARLGGDGNELLPLLADLVDEVVRPLLATGEVRRWFYLPFENQGPEMRLRLFGDPAVLWSPRCVGALRDIVAPHLRRRSLRGVSFDTYRRETYRYGGPAGMDLAEEHFQRSSELSLDLHQEVDFLAEGDFQPYLFTLVTSLRSLLRATRLPLDEQRLIAQSASVGFERQADRSESRKLAGDLYRLHHAELLGRRSEDEDLVDLFARARSALTDRFGAWVADCLHVHSLRLLTPWHPQPHLEIVAYHLLVRMLGSERAGRAGDPG